MGVGEMTRCVIKFKDGELLNLVADYIDLRDGNVMAWRGESLVLIAKVEEVISCHLSEKKG
jgi:hypothetical protein